MGEWVRVIQSLHFRTLPLCVHFMDFFWSGEGHDVEKGMIFWFRILSSKKKIDFFSPLEIFKKTNVITCLLFGGIGSIFNMSKFAVGVVDSPQSCL